MDVQVEQLSPVLVEFSVTVENARVKQELDKAFADLGKRAKVRGFRPGKAPREVLNQLFGGSVTNDVASKLVDESLNQALVLKNVQPLSQPQIEVKSISANSELVYKARFEVRPEIVNLKWEGLDATKPVVKLEDKHVDEALESVRKQLSTLAAPEPVRAAKSGDVITIDFVATVDSKQIEDSKGVTTELGDGRFVKELEDAIIGASVGDKRDVDVDFPATHANPALQGKKGHFAITLTDVKERKLPALDDELAKDAGKFENLDALKADIREKLTKQLTDASEQQLVTTLVAALCNANPVQAPSALVQQQAQITLGELQQQARRTGQRVNMTDELQRQILADSDVKVRAGLLMAEIAKLQGVQVNDDDIESGLKDLAAETGKNVAKLRVEYRDQNKRQMLLGMIIEDKVLDLMIAKANVKEVDPSAAPEAK
ncbi:MAG: trigger factor [Polyangiales bacterium]